MTAQKLYEILKFLETLDKQLELQTRLEAVTNSLSNLVSQPAQPPHQSAFGKRARCVRGVGRATTRINNPFAIRSD